MHNWLFMKFSCEACDSTDSESMLSVEISSFCRIKTIFILFSTSSIVCTNAEISHLLEGFLVIFSSSMSSWFSLLAFVSLFLEVPQSGPSDKSLTRSTSDDLNSSFMLAFLFVALCVLPTSQFEYFLEFLLFG